MRDAELIGCPAVLALELSGGRQPDRMCLDRDQAATLAELVAEDLRGLLPGVEQARLALVGAHFDAAEVLRPTFPLHTTTQELATRIHGDVVAFGTHDGRMPAQALQPDPALAGAALRLIPWTLLVPEAHVQALGSVMETELVGRGEVGTRTADFLIRAWGVPLEHARYFTRHDLMALICVQYEHVNMAPLWNLLEAALLSPQSNQSVLSARGLHLHYIDGQVRAQTPGAWLAKQPGEKAVDARSHALAAVIFELRQYRALLAAHHVPLAFAGGEYFPSQGWLFEPDPTSAIDGASVSLRAHTAPGLGTVAISAVQSRLMPSDAAQACPGTDDRERVLACAWVLGDDVEGLCAEMARRFGTPAPATRHPLQVDATDLFPTAESALLP